MALKFLFFHLITVMVAVNLVVADEEESERFGLPSFGGGNSSGGFFGLPFFGSGSNSPGGLPSLPNIPFLGFFGQIPSAFGSRQERSADNHESDEEEPQDRLFFGNIVSCNYSTQDGRSCTSCRQALACYPNNRGRVRTCRGLLRYCNNGRCSFIPGAQCSTTSSTSAATTESSNMTT